MLADLPFPGGALRSGEPRGNNRSRTAAVRSPFRDLAKARKGAARILAVCSQRNLGCCLVPGLAVDRDGAGTRRSPDRGRLRRLCLWVCGRRPPFSGNRWMAGDLLDCRRRLTLESSIRSSRHYQ